MHQVPITFEHNGKHYTGHFHAVAGAGSTRIWHLMVDNYYKGCLRFTDKWVFDSNCGMEDLAKFFGEFILLNT